MDTGEYTVMPLIIPLLLQSNRAVVEDVEEGLVSTTEGACRGLELPPKAQVLVVGQGVSGSVKGKLECSLW